MTQLFVIELTIKIIFFILFVITIAFFAGSETALTALSIEQSRKIESKKPKLKTHIKFLHEHFNRILSIILIGTNCAMIGASVIVSSLSYDFSKLTTNHIWLFIIPFLSTLIILYFGEIIPKVYGKINAEPVSIFALPIIHKAVQITTPVINISVKLSETLISPFVERLDHEVPFPTFDEFKTLFAMDEAKKVLKKGDRQIITNIIDFGRISVNQIMVPRVKISAVDINTSRDEVINLITNSGFSRIPVYDKTLDNIVGIIFARDLLNAWRYKDLIIIQDLVRPAFFIPETKNVSELLHEFKTGHYHMAVIVDEYGGTAGIVTIEDLVEEIVGEIYDEYDIKEQQIISLPDGAYILPADTELSRINAELKLELPETEFATLNGWVLDIFGCVPRRGETKSWGNIKIEIVESTRKRVSKIKIVILKTQNGTQNI